MSTPAASAAIGAPSAVRAAEPAWVRKGSPQVQRSYAAALAFEQTLVEQLAKTMLAGNGLGEGEAGAEEGAAPSDAGSGLVSSLLPQALGSGVASNGGFGLAAELTRGAADAESQRASGGTAPHAPVPTQSSAPTGGST